MERILAVDDQRARCEIELEVLTDQVSLSDVELEQRLEKEVANSGVDQVLKLPIELDESIFGWHVKAEKAFEEFGALHVILETILVPEDAVFLEQFLQDLKVPVMEFFDPQNFGCLDLLIQFGEVEEELILVIVRLQVELEIRNDLLIVHALSIRHLIKELVGLHEELRELFDRQWLEDFLALCGRVAIQLVSQALRHQAA